MATRPQNFQLARVVILHGAAFEHGIISASELMAVSFEPFLRLAKAVNEQEDNKRAWPFFPYVLVCRYFGNFQFSLLYEQLICVL